MPSRVRKVIVSQGGTPDPNQQYERMILYNDDGSNYEPPAGGVGDVAPVTSEEPTTIHNQWTVLDSENTLNITVSGKVYANANHDPGKVILMISDDGGATGTTLDQLSTTTASPGVDYTIKGIVPAGYSVFVGFTQEAAGQNGQASITDVVTQILN